MYALSLPSRPAVPVLHEVSFAIQAGEKVAIVGPSGAGKSTIFNLILRFYDPYSGTIRCEGIPWTDLISLALRRHIALVPQEPMVFATSVRENIRFGRRQATDAEWSARRRPRLPANSSTGCRGDLIPRSESAERHSREDSVSALP